MKTREIYIQIPRKERPKEMRSLSSSKKKKKKKKSKENKGSTEGKGVEKKRQWLGRGHRKAAF